MKRAAVMAMGLLAFACLHATHAQARGGTTWTVTGLGEPATITSMACVSTNCPTLRDAVNTAASSDTITFASALNGKTITLNFSSNDLSSGSSEFGPSSFFISNKSLTIDGRNHGITLARSTAQPAFRLFDVDSSSSLTLIGLTLRNGLAKGGGSNAGGGALGAGGAVFNQGGLVLDSCTLAYNTAQGGSGGLSQLTGSAAGGGGVGQDATTLDGGGPNGGASGAPPANGAFGGGGGATTDISHNGAVGGFGGGGGKGTSVTAAGAGGFGAGGGGDAFTRGDGGFGGGIGGGDADHVPAGGGGAGMGGALFNDAGIVSLVNTTFYANTANGGNTSYTGTGAAGGNGSGFGGAIFNYAGTLQVSFSTFDANITAIGSGGDGGATEGGAIYSYADSNCGISDGNLCAGGDADLEMVNSIAAHGVGAAHDIVIDGTAGTSTSAGGGNLILAQLGFGGTFIGGDPKLGALSPSALAPATLPIPATSPAHDAAASCTDTKSQTVATDARGIARPQGSTCDIGAYESNGDYIYANSYE